MSDTLIFILASLCLLVIIGIVVTGVLNLLHPRHKDPEQ